MLTRLSFFDTECYHPLSLVQIKPFDNDDYNTSTANLSPKLTLAIGTGDEIGETGFPALHSPKSLPRSKSFISPSVDHS